MDSFSDKFSNHNSFSTFLPSQSSSYSSSVFYPPLSVKKSLSSNSRQFLPTQELTPPLSTRSSCEEIKNKEDSPYERAYSYWKLCKDQHAQGRIISTEMDSEKPFSVKLSKNEWITLSSQLNSDESDDVYPRISYNAATEKIMIQCMPYPLHESIVSNFTTHFHEGIPKELKKTITLYTNTSYRGFKGKYAGSERISDISIAVENAEGELQLKWIMEVGVAQSYNDLVDNISTWIEGKPTISMAILVQVVENPPYRCPVKKDEYIKCIYPEEDEIKSTLFKMEEPYGPVTYNGSIWFGQLTNVVLEFWRRNLITGLAERYDKFDLLSSDDTSDIQIKLSHFLSISQENDKVIPFDWDFFRQYLVRRGIIDLAVLRCQKMIGRFNQDSCGS